LVTVRVVDTIGWYFQRSEVDSRKQNCSVGNGDDQTQDTQASNIPPEMWEW